MSRCVQTIFFRPLIEGRWRLVALIASSAAAAVAPVQARATIDQNTVSLIADSTIDFSHGGHPYFEYFAPDGTSRGGNGADKVEIGKWYVRQDNTVCFIHDDLNQSGCVFVQARESSIEFHRIDGVVEGPFGHLRGNPKGL
jgi:hypothetical protein